MMVLVVSLSMRCGKLVGRYVWSVPSTGSLESFGGGQVGRSQVRWKCLSLDNMNPQLVKLQYAVRGPLVARALAIESELKAGKSSKPFKSVIKANLGDSHAMGQKPITFVRQVLACTAEPSLIQDSCYPDDVKERATALLGACLGSVGCYSNSNGVQMIRDHVAQYIECRDGFPCDVNNVVLSTGASASIKYALSLFQNNPSGKPSGIMIPIPQYPLYTATIAEYGLYPVRYYLDEDKNWGLDVSELERALQEGSECSDVRAIVIINPGNPTGQVLTKKNIEEIIKFASSKNLFIFADEVYQDNIYAEGSAFHSFKKVMMEMGEPYSKIEVASFMSISKGYMGECGLRGGWMEAVNLDPEVQAHLYKTISANLCSSVLGQVAVDCCASPPKSGDPSYELFIKEKSGLLNTLKERSQMVHAAFNEMEGFKCNVLQGAMYAFPRFEMSQKAIDAAKAEKKAPDVFYAFKLLEDTGICIVAGSGFGQREGTYHFRTTILAQTPVLKQMLEVFRKFHEKFTKDFS